MNRKVLIVNYNTTLLTQCCIKSVNNFTPGCKIYVFDNSDKEPFVNIFENVEVIDNTKGQIINWEEWKTKYIGNKRTKGAHNNYASAKHCFTVEKCMELINDNFVLLDSDVLIKKDFSDLYNEDYIYVAETKYQIGKQLMRVVPFICFINVKLCKEKDIHFFSEYYMHGLGNGDGDYWDTGAYFYNACKNEKHKEIKFINYVEHFGNASWRDKNVKEWLNKNNVLWENLENSTMKKINEDYKAKILNFGKIHGFNFNIDNPQTIQDKIQWLKLYDSTPLKTKCADKIKVHDYCKEKLGKDICVPILKVYNNTNEINWNELPQQFVIKCNHGSGMNIVVKDKNTMNKADVVEKLNKWMKTDFAFQNGCELHYHDIEHKIFFEKYEEDETQKNSLLDYKFWCFNGEPKFLTIGDGLGHGRMAFFDLNFNEIDIERTDYKKLDNVLKPKNFNLMIEYAKKLCQDFKLVRVDFYEVNNEVYLGELTFTPGSGIFRYKNEKDNYKIGDMLKLKEKNKKVVYTCISGNYDVLLEPEFISDGFDYVCFTDQPFTSKVWQIKPIPEELSYLSEVKRQRNIKIKAHEYLSEYDFSVWVDGNISLKGDINKYVEKNCNDKDVVFYVGKHPFNNCIYKEGDTCIKLKKDTKENINRQIEAYKKEGFPKNLGLPQTCIILRYHNEESCKRLMETWWKEVEKYSHRDQLSFNYALWKNQDVKIKYLETSIFNCETFKWNCRHKKANILRVKSRINSVNSKKDNISVWVKTVNNEVKQSQVSNVSVRTVEEKKKTLRERIEEIRANRERKINGPNYFGEY